jgi:hypothetical protein
MKRILTVLLILFGLVRLADAHNGAVAIAVPVEGITLDGDFSDWPNDMQRYPLRQEGGDPLEGLQDFKGMFLVGYNETEHVLYLAVEVQDESLVLERVAGAQPWNGQDGCEVYLVAPHQKDQATQYAWWGEQRSMSPRRGVYLPWEHAEAQVQRQAGVHRYEWKLDLGAIADVELEPGTTLGLDVAVIDRDEDGSVSYGAWGAGINKGLYVDRVGDVVLMGTSDEGMPDVEPAEAGSIWK